MDVAAHVQDTENSWSPSIVSHHQEDGRPQFTGGSTGIVWGSQGVWEEPWTHASALKTLQLLDANWNRLKSPRLMRDLARDMQSQIDCPSATQVRMPAVCCIFVSEPAAEAWLSPSRTCLLW